MCGYINYIDYCQQNEPNRNAYWTSFKLPTKFKTPWKDKNYKIWQILFSFFIMYIVAN